MPAGAVVQARVPGSSTAPRTKAGAAGTLYNVSPDDRLDSSIDIAGAC